MVDGALAASAPVLQFFNTGVSQWVYSEDTTFDFKVADPRCPGRVLTALRGIMNLSASSDGRAQLTKIYSLCQPLTSGDQLNDYFSDALSYLAMANYRKSMSGVSLFSFSFFPLSFFFFQILINFVLAISLLFLYL